MQEVQEYKKFTINKTMIQPWLICIAASLFFFYEFIQGNMFASIADNIMRDFNIQADKMVYMSSIYYLSNVIFLFIAGMLLDRFSSKKTIVMAMILCIAGTFILASTNSFYVALFCRFLTGIGSAFCFLGPVRIASRWFPPQRMALVTGIIVTIAMSGGLMSQYPLTQLVLSIGWRESLNVVAWLGIGMLLVMMLWIKDKPANYIQPQYQELPILAIAKKAYLNPQTTLAALYCSLMNMAVAVFGAMMGTLYLMQRLGINKGDASKINTMIFLGAIIGGPIIGWISDKINLRVLPMKISGLISLIIVLSILYFPVSVTGMTVLFFMLGFFTAAQVISYALVAESSCVSMTAAAVSIVSILTQGGYVIYQNLFSYLLKLQGDTTVLDGVSVPSITAYQVATVILPIGLCLALISVLKLKETYCRRKDS